MQIKTFSKLIDMFKLKNTTFDNNVNRNGIIVKSLIHCAIDFVPLVIPELQLKTLFVMSY